MVSITIVNGAYKQTYNWGATLWNWLEIGGKILGSDMNIMIYYIMISYWRGETDYDIVNALFLIAFNSYCFLIDVEVSLILSRFGLFGVPSGVIKHC